MQVNMDKFIFPTEFVIMDMEGDIEVHLILGKPFMRTTHFLIYMRKGKLKSRVQDEEMIFNMFGTKHPTSKDNS